MNFNEIYEWLKNQGYINDSWEKVVIDGDSFYAEDNTENTFISIFTRWDHELVIYVGCLRSKVSVGSGTGYYVSNYWDVINFLKDNLEDMYNELTRKVESK